MVVDERRAANVIAEFDPTPPACAALSSALDEALPGTAPTNPAWLLIEQPGPWGRDRLRQSRLDPQIGNTIALRCADAGVRPVLIRSAHRRRLDHTRNVFLVHPGHSGESWMEHIDLSDERELLDLDVSATHSPTPPRIGDPVSSDQSIFLVCTHGKKDACCAKYGRPVAAALDRDLSGERQVWESTHLGGDRFAATFAAFPAGIYYGRATPENVQAIAVEHVAGRTTLTNFRGRCTDQPVMQVAEHAVRSGAGLLGLDEVVATSVVSPSPDEYQVTIRSPDSTVLVHIRIEVQTPRLTACTQQTLGSPQRFEVLAVTAIAA